MQKLSMEQLNRLSVDDYKKVEKTPVVVLLDNVRSALNVGSVFRTCDAFRIEKIILCGISACPPNNEIRKTAIGAELSVDWQYEKNTIDAVNKLKKDGYEIVAVEQAVNSIPLNKLCFNSNSKVALVFGNEVNGVNQEIMDICHRCVEIPQFGTKHSLNVSVSAGIVIWEVFKLLNSSLSNN